MAWQRRDLVALIVALLFTGIAIALLYLFVDRIWSALPVAVTLPLFILLAVVAIGSPIYTLLKLSDRALERQRRRTVKRPSPR